MAKNIGTLIFTIKVEPWLREEWEKLEDEKKVILLALAGSATFPDLIEDLREMAAELG